MAGKAVIGLYDTVQLMPSSVKTLKSLQDSFVSSDSTKPIVVTLAATHAGRLSRNYTFYMPEKMKRGVESWTDNYQKPVLLHHKSGGGLFSDPADPVGRVLSARYIDTSNTIQRDAVNDKLVRTLCDAKGSFLSQIEAVRKLADSAMLQESDFPGLGFIELTAKVSDPDAVQKILDGRYLTVSIGATTDHAVCSICGRDLVEEGFCDHRPGKEYPIINVEEDEDIDEDKVEKRLCYIIAGNLQYEEVSFVNSPADTLARVISINRGGVTQDTIMAEDSTNSLAVNASFQIADDASIGGLSMKVNDQDKPSGDQEPEDQTAVEDDKDTNIDGTVHDDKADTDVEPDKSDLEDSKEDDKDKDDQDEEDIELDDSDEHYDAMMQLAEDLALVDDIEDKKMSPKTRKNLPKSAFCKPKERKYPVTDCGHAKSAMAYAKKYNEPSYVISCIRRKAKALGCPFDSDKKKKDDGTELEAWEFEIDQILDDLAEREAQATQQDDTQPVEPETPEKSETDAGETQDKVACEQCAKYKEQLAALRQELHDVYAELQEAYAEKQENITRAKDALIAAQKKYLVLTGKQEEFNEEALAGMTLCELADDTNSKAKLVDVAKIVDKLNDGMDSTPTESVEDPTLSDEAQEDPTTEQSNDFLTQVRDAFVRKLEEHDERKAWDYIRLLKENNLIPDDFDPRK